MLMKNLTMMILTSWATLRWKMSEPSLHAGAIPVAERLFSLHYWVSHTKNATHRTDIHNFFIPHIKYLSDVKWLINDTRIGKIYLWYNERGKWFYHSEAVQAHKNKSLQASTYGDATLEFPGACDFRSSPTDRREGMELRSCLQIRTWNGMRKPWCWSFQCQISSSLLDEVPQMVTWLIKSCGNQKAVG